MEIIQITCQLISDPKHQIINDCGVCPGVDIIASIAQYSTEIFPMTGPGSHGHHHHYQPSHWSE